jgi:hypothetical protein
VGRHPGKRAAGFRGKPPLRSSHDIEETTRRVASPPVEMPLMYAVAQWLERCDFGLWPSLHVCLRAKSGLVQDGHQMAGRTGRLSQK